MNDESTYIYGDEAQLESLEDIMRRSRYIRDNFIQTISERPEIGRAVEFSPRWSAGIVQGIYGDNGFYEVGRVWGGSEYVSYWRYIDD